MDNSLTNLTIFSLMGCFCAFKIQHANHYEFAIATNFEPERDVGITIKKKVLFFFFCKELWAVHFA